MIILHIAAIDGNPFSGVNIVVPEHVKHQSKYADVALLNVKKIKISDVKKQFFYNTAFLNSVPSPYIKPDLVVFHECYNKYYLLIYRYLHKNHIPYIIVPHGELRKEAQRKKRFKKIIANIFLFNKFISNAIALQLLSKSEAENTKFNVPRFISTNGIELPLEHKTNFPLQKNTWNILYIGRMDWQVKGIDLLIHAVEIIQEVLRLHHVKINMYGPDVFGRHAVIKKMIRQHHVEDLITLAPEVCGNKKEALLMSADIFIQTSRHEGMPMGILEAMSYGIPCIITEGTTLGPLFRKSNCGWVAETNAKSIADTIMRALNEKERYAQYGSNARQIIAEQFQWEKIAKEAIASYKNLLGIKE